MRSVFADSYYYLALVSRDATARHRAEEVSRELSARVVTTSWVLVEVANALAHLRQFRNTNRLWRRQEAGSCMIRQKRSATISLSVAYCH
jgi:hypothetical protein